MGHVTSFYDSNLMQWITPYEVYSPDAYASFDASKYPYGYGLDHQYYDPRYNVLPALQSYTVDLEFVSARRYVLHPDRDWDSSRHLHRAASRSRP